MTSSVSGMTMTVDGSNCTAPCTFSWTAGSSHTIAGPSGTGTSAWSQGYTYDGFGNLTAITGTQANSWSYDAATNHGPNSDANGNGNSAASSGAYTYDIENRIVNTGSSNGNYSYSYAPGNKRVWKGTTTYDAGYGQNVPAADEITFWSPAGQKLGTYNLVEAVTTSSVDGSRCVTNFSATQTGTNYYFGGKLIKNAPGSVFSDRLGSVGKYYPYGSDKGSGNPSSGEKFTGYQQDSETGLDYADQRFQQPGSGRFLTADRLRGNVADSDSWNKYAYTRGDPINRKDPMGAYDCTVGNGEGLEYTDCEDVSISTTPVCMPIIQAIHDGNPGVTPEEATACGITLSQPQAAPARPGPNDTVTPDQVKYETQSAVKTALFALQNNPGCAAVFQGYSSISEAGVPSAFEILNSIWTGDGNSSYGSIKYDNEPAAGGQIDNAWTSPNGKAIMGTPYPFFGYPSATITINTNANAPYNAGGNPIDNAVTILHELGHLMDFLWGSEPRRSRRIFRIQM